MKRIDRIAGFLGIALSGFIFYITADFPADHVVKVGPAFFPRLLAVGLALSCVLLIVYSYLKTHAQVYERFSLKDRGVQRGLVSVAATVVYCLLFELLGFITCTVFYLLFLMVLLKEKNYLQMIMTTVLTTAAVFIVFKVFLNITLPLGTIYGF